MKIIETVEEMRSARQDLRRPVALVATLGGLHAGHEAHLARARELAASVVGSLFLNPAQFGADEDLSSYPSDRKHDLAVFEKHGADIVFAPPVEEMYPPGGSVRVDPGPIGNLLEGAHRPGHFEGVATVVSKLFAIIRPDIATFGEKDAQQLQIVRKLNDEMGFGVEIVPVPTVREADGLALSSRNVYLDPQHRAAAPVLYRALCAGRAAWERGERSADLIRASVEQVLGEEPLVMPQYVSVARPDTLEEVEGEAPGEALLSLAAQVGPARLIDNVMLR